MSLKSAEDIQTLRAGASAPWLAAWEWLARPMHYRAVRNFRISAASGDGERLASLLDPGIAVAVDSGEVGHRAVRVVRGSFDAVALLLHGMADRPGRVIIERSVNGQAGLMLCHDDEASAAVAVDFNGPLISVVWIRLHPRLLRHWNKV